jgi:hypothetical protein
MAASYFVKMRAREGREEAVRELLLSNVARIRARERGTLAWNDERDPRGAPTRRPDRGAVRRRQQLLDAVPGARHLGMEFPRDTPDPNPVLLEVTALGAPA